MERTIPGVAQKMLIQQLRELERDEIVTRKIYPQVPPKVEYSLTKWGKAMCPALELCLNMGRGTVGIIRSPASQREPLWQ